MEILYFTVAGIFLYFFSDWILERIEAAFGKRLEYRSLIFFAIILILSTSLFNLVQYLQTDSGGNSAGKEIVNTPGEQSSQDSTATPD